jgi:chemotaxis regulatin CheY-phosphate phosphatase CheZ
VTDQPNPGETAAEVQWAMRDDENAPRAGHTPLNILDALAHIEEWTRTLRGHLSGLAEENRAAARTLDAVRTAMCIPASVQIEEHALFLARIEDQWMEAKAYTHYAGDDRSFVAYLDHLYRAAHQATAPGAEGP